MAQHSLTQIAGQFDKFLKRIDPKTLRKMVRGALVSGGAVIRRGVIKAARATGWHNADRIAKGVRYIIPKKTLDHVTVTVAPAPKIGGVRGGYHLNRKARWKPIPQWMNVGAKRKKHGIIQPTHYVQSAEAATMQKAIEAAAKSFDRKIAKLAEKFGEL